MESNLNPETKNNNEIVVQSELNLEDQDITSNYLYSNV